MHKNIKSYEKGHPNPLFYRPNWTSLNGEWDLCFDSENIGLTHGYSSAVPSSTKIQVPYAYETPRSGVTDKSEHHILWYSRHFAKPKWAAYKRTLLHIERCDYVFDGWLNGHYLGRHIGGYDAFAFDITDYLSEGDNFLSFRVYDDLDPKIVRGLQSSEEKLFGPFYPHTTGLYSDVWLEGVGGERVKGYDARGSYEEKSVYLRLLFTHKARGATLKIVVSYRGKKITEASLPITGTYLETSLSLPKREFHAWSPSHPCLYDLALSVVRQDEVQDEVFSYFGICEITQRKRFLFINGRKQFLKLALYKGYNKEGGLTFTEEEYQRDVSLIKAMGFNGVRIYQKVESELFYYLADREGLFTDVEMPSAYAYDSAEAKRAADQFGIYVRDHCGHPSVIAYVAYDESRGIENIKSDPTEQEQATSLYDMANRIDWTRPVISNDGFEHTKSDLLTLHNYSDNEKEMLSFAKDYAEAVNKEDNFMVFGEEKAFADGFHYGGQPLIMSEFFGASLHADGGGHGKPAFTNRTFLKRYRGLLRALRKMGFAGYCASSYCDTALEKTGFVTEERKPKVSPESVKKANAIF